MGGSEMGDDLLDNQKSGQRISERAKKPVSYSSLVHGTGDVSASMDYGEISGANRSMQRKPMP